MIAAEPPAAAKLPPLEAVGTAADQNVSASVASLTSQNPPSTNSILKSNASVISTALLLREASLALSVSSTQAAVQKPSADGGASITGVGTVIEASSLTTLLPEKPRNIALQSKALYSSTVATALPGPESLVLRGADGQQDMKIVSEKVQESTSAELNRNQAPTQASGSKQDALKLSPSIKENNLVDAGSF